MLVYGIKRILSVRVAGVDFMVFVEGTFFVLLIQSGC
jgi:hypothetical protein